MLQLKVALVVRPMRHPSQSKKQKARKLTVKKKSQLPRLAPESYRGQSMVFWTYTIEDRRTGWLGDPFHQKFREILLHSAIRHRFVVPVYCLMPDHLHWLGMGVCHSSDQLLGSRFLRKHLADTLAPAKWQRQPHDHVLRLEEREKSAFASIGFYILENPVRKGLVSDRNEWSYSGALIPGYPDLDWRKDDYWELFWKIYNREVSGEGVL